MHPYGMSHAQDRKKFRLRYASTLRRHALARCPGKRVRHQAKILLHKEDTTE